MHTLHEKDHFAKRFTCCNFIVFRHQAKNRIYFMKWNPSFSRCWHYTRLYTIQHLDNSPFYENSATFLSHMSPMSDWTKRVRHYVPVSISYSFSHTYDELIVCLKQLSLTLFVLHVTPMFIWEINSKWKQTTSTHNASYRTQHGNILQVVRNMTVPFTRMRHPLVTTQQLLQVGSA